MQVFSDKIESRKTGVTSTPPFLTESNFNRGETGMATNKIPKICSVDGCDRCAVARGWCKMHWQRWRQHGDVMAVVGSRGRSTVLTAEQRFWLKTAVTANPDKCWDWQGSINHNGYGVTGYKYQAWRAHRLAWYLTTGKVPRQYILHSCDNRRCVNPNHLREGTAAENSRDMVEKGRQRQGRGRRKLTIQQVVIIKQMLNTEADNIPIARQFGVARSTISCIRRGITWRHVQ